MSNFTIKHYLDTIKSYKSNEYSFNDLKEPCKGEKSIVLVHDVDHHINLCENLIDAEQEAEVNSTFFLRIHARAYNMLSRDSIKISKKIIESGSSIGLHYEPTFCGESKELEHHIKKEMDILSDITGQEIKFFNIHEPFRTKIDLSDFLPEQNRCYNSKILNQFKYLSDSSCRWREGCFSEHINKWNKILVLTHPLWWYKKDPTENY